MVVCLLAAMFRRLVSLAVGVALVAPVCYGGDPLPRANPQDVGVSAENLAKIKPALQNFAAQRKLPGAVVMIARHGKLIYSEAVGYDRTDYIFRLFSQSKPITAAAAMVLLDDGVIKLDDPVTKWIPEFQALRVIVNGTMGAPIETVPLKRTMTVLHLLTHTAGFVYGDGGDTTVDAMYRAGKVLDMWNQNLDGLVDKLARIPLLNHPGVEWRYSVGIDVLGCLIQRAAGMPLATFMQRRLFEPLGMADTGFMVPSNKLHRLVPYWTSAAAPGLLVPIPNSYTGTDFSRDPPLKSGGGGLVSTAADYLRFAQMLLNHGELDGKRVLKEETVKAYMTNQLPKTLLPFKMGNVVFRTSVRPIDSTLLHRDCDIIANHHVLTRPPHIFSSASTAPCHPSR